MGVVCHGANSITRTFCAPASTSLLICQVMTPGNVFCNVARPPLTPSLVRVSFDKGAKKISFPPRQKMYCVSNGLQIEMLREEIVMDLGHETWWPVLVTRLVY